MSEPSAVTASTSRPLPRALSIASSLCWLLAIFPGIVVITLSGSEFLAFVQRAGLMTRLELSLGAFADAVAYGAAGYLLRKMGPVSGWFAVLAPGLLTLDRLRFLLTSDSGTSLELLTNLVVILLNLVIVMLVVRGWRHFQSDDSIVPGRPGVSLAHGLRVAAIVCFTCGILIGLFTISFVISGARDANPLASLALVYLVPAIAYCMGGYLLIRRRRVGNWFAIVTAVAWSALLLAYDGQPGWLWTGSASFFLIANVVIMLLVVLSWRHGRAFNRQVDTA